jgi:hypothetical protein
MYAFFNTAAQSIFGHAAGFNFRTRTASNVIGFKPSTRLHAVRPGHVTKDGEIETGFGHYEPTKGYGPVKVERTPLPSGIFEIVQGKLGWYNVGMTAEGKAPMLAILARTTDELEALITTLPLEQAEVFGPMLIERRAHDAVEEVKREASRVAAEEARAKIEAKEAAKEAATAVLAAEAVAAQTGIPVEEAVTLIAPAFAEQVSENLALAA